MKLYKAVKRIARREYFNEVYNQNLFSGSESLSGPGSTISETEEVRRIISHVLNKFECTSLLDLPCGDFTWMREMTLDGVKYTGADVSSVVVSKLQNEFSGDSKRFMQIDICDEVPPKHDLVFTRDLLVHQSYHEAKATIDNLIESGSKYLLTTTFPLHHENTNIKKTQDSFWYPINLMDKPFRLPTPIEMYNEKCSEMNGLYSDKSLALYNLQTLKRKNTGGRWI